jgi:membrane protease YdiL (CAAX protease family)
MFEGVVSKRETIRASLAVHPSTAKALAACAALGEIVLVRLALLMFLNNVVPKSLGAWQTQHLFNDFSNHILLFVGPLLVLRWLHRPLAGYGVTLAHWREDLRAALSVYLFFTIAGGLLQVTGVWRAGLYLLALICSAWRLNGKTRSGEGWMVLVLSGLVFGMYGLNCGLFPGTARGLSNLAFYGFAAGLGEETFYRGYAQSRLNAVFGKPYNFMGCQIGWGWLLTAALFGLFHFGGGPLYMLWAVFAGLAFGYIYERTHSIVAPAILHGLPQGLCLVFIFYG